MQIKNKLFMYQLIVADIASVSRACLALDRLNGICRYIKRIIVLQLHIYIKKSLHKRVFRLIKLTLFVDHIRNLIGFFKLTAAAFQLRDKIGY